MNDTSIISWIVGTVALSCVMHLCIWLIRKRTTTTTTTLSTRSSPSTASSSSPVRVHALRLTPGEELKSSILQYCADHSLDAAFVITCVGSLNRAHLRLAFPDGEAFDRKSWSEGIKWEKRSEILSLVGTIADRGEFGHLHISLGDASGAVMGGHLIGDAIIGTTAEIVLGECQSLTFSREHDSRTGFGELAVKGR